MPSSPKPKAKAGPKAPPPSQKRGTAPKPSAAKTAPRHVNSHELAVILGCSHSRVYQLVGDGMPKAGPDRYELAACVQWRINQAQMSSKSSGSKIADELKRSTKTKIDLQIAQMRGELLPRPLVEQLMLRLMTMAASQLESLPPRVAADLVDLTTPIEIQNQLMIECRATRDLLSAEVAAAASEMRERRGISGLEDDSELAELEEVDG